MSILDKIMVGKLSAGSIISSPLDLSGVNLATGERTIEAEATLPIWYIDANGRICTIVTFAHGAFDDTPMFIQAALEHNNRIAMKHLMGRKS